ncbi:DELLA protein GAI1 [Dendrobium catenatum]|uniref:DELLA protein GAI1 n=1 Tax=Dendrobium catenatum TaxID=906689 RepID=A0A2I0X903_9ASPA|nr:DELLA protein GAI1 [Dendrobium catenatum]
MKGEVADDLLNLSLSIGQTKKRKRTDQNLAIAAVLHARNRMLHQTTPILLDHNIDGLHLIRLLLLSASAADLHDFSTAVESLLHLYPQLSLSGDPIQRVAAYFSDAILANLIAPSSPLYSSLSPSPTPHEEFSAFTSLYLASPYLQFAHFTANQAIIDAFEAEEHWNGGSLHVIDFDVSYGFQWPSLIQSLADKAKKDKPFKLRITGFGRSEAELKETEARLSGFSKGCRNLYFEFEGKNMEINSFKDLNLWENSTVVVNSVFNLHMLKSSTLQLIQSLNPSLLILVEKEGRRTETTSKSFLSRFMESLQYFAAMFDSLDDCLPAGSKERLRIEKNYLGREIRNAVDMKQEEDEKEVLIKYGTLATWKEAMERSGFEGVMMSSRSVSQAKLLLKIKSHCSTMEEHGGGAGFRISERDDGRAISLGWHDSGGSTRSKTMQRAKGNLHGFDVQAI